MNIINIMYVTFGLLLITALIVITWKSWGDFKELMEE